MSVVGYGQRSIGHNGAGLRGRQLGRIDATKPFIDLEKLCHVNERAHAADKDPDFSQRIRMGLPMPAPLP